MSGEIGGIPARPVNLDASVKVYHLPTWGRMEDPDRLKMLRRIALEAGRDPRIATVAIQILRANRIEPRDYTGQAQALLRFVQRRIYYANEPGERLQDPAYTLRVGYGDCDDMALLLAALCESIRLPWRFVISGKRGNQIVRWMEGTPYRPAMWAHIYLAIGNRPFKPTRWVFAEPTLRSVNLGWDVVAASKGGSQPLPELSGVDVAVGFSKDKPKRDDAEALTVEGVLTDVKKALTPRRIIVGIIVGGITGMVGRSLYQTWAKSHKRR